MFERHFDVSIASFPDWESRVGEEIAQADLVQFPGKVAGGVYHPSSIVWEGWLTNFENPKSFIFTKKDRKTIAKQQLYFADAGYDCQVVPLTIPLFEEFLVVYHQTTMQKKRAIQYDLETVRGKILSGSEIYVAGLFLNQKLRSGLLFGKFLDKIQVLFGAKQRFEKIPGGVGGLLEYALLEFSFEHKVKKITHGRGPCPAGIDSNAGLFAFKSRYGFSAFPDGQWQTTFIRNSAIFLSDAIFIIISDDRLQYLVAAQEPTEELQKRYRTRMIREVQVVSVSELAAEHQKILMAG